MTGQYHALKNTSVYVTAGSFENYNGWVLDTQFIANMGSEYLLAHGLGKPVEDAVTRVTFPGTGDYRLWVYTRDWVSPWKHNMAPGIFKVIVGGQESPVVFGTQGPQWDWQDGGMININEFNVTILLRDLTGFEGRCAALFFTQDINFIPPADIQEIAQMRRILNGYEETQDLGSYDFIAAGGGIAGICAAVAAARRGLKTALIHDRYIPGGNNSSEVRVWSNGKSNMHPFPHLGNIVCELDPGTKFEWGQENGPGNTAELFEDEKKIKVLKNEPNIDLYSGHFLTGVDMDGNAIQNVIVYNVKTGVNGKIGAKYFADCTGDGDMGFYAGAHFETTTNGHMGMTNIWHLEETDSPHPFPRCPWAIDLSNVDFPGRKQVKSVYGQLGVKALGGWYWEAGMEHPPIEMAEYARDTNFRAMYGAVDCIKNIDGDFKNHRLAFAAYIAGKRESRRLFGDIVLSKSDVFSNTCFPDGIVPTTWSFDVHYPDRTFYTAFHEGDAFLTKDYHEVFPAPFFIPYRCLYSRNIDNLFMAGRDVSVTHDALGSVRVQRTGGMMGEVVGTAAAICFKYNCRPRTVYEKYLQELLDVFR